MVSQQVTPCYMISQSMTNDDLKALPTLAGNEKKRKYAIQKLHVKVIILCCWSPTEL